MARFLAGLLLLLLALQDPLPDRSTWKDEVKAMRAMAYWPAAKYDELDKKIDAATTLDLAKAAARDLVQAAYDHEDTTFAVSMALDFPAGLPDQIEVEKYTLKDGRVLIGIGGPLARHYKMVSADSLLGQRVLDPNLGLGGMSNLWIAKEDTTKIERAKVPLPKVLLARPGRESFDEKGRLVIDGDWIRAGKTERETVVLDVADAQSGGTLYVSESLGLRTLRPSRHDIKEIEPPKRTAMPVPFAAKIAELREKAPDVEWPEPFDPDGDFAAAEKLIDGDAELSLLRVRFALTYGKDLPELATKDPKAMLAIEKRVRAYLDGGNVEIKDDWRVVAAAVRHAMSTDRPDLKLVRFPKSHSPWRPAPLLIVLHGQYCQPQHDFDIWGAMADKAGMVLVCPRYGSPEGTKRDIATDEEIFGVVRKLLLRGDIDPDRVYLTGISMGGATTWSLSTGYPGRWAAAAPEIHGPNMDNGKPLLLRNLRTLPYFIFEGEFDGLNTIFSRAAVEELKKAKAPVAYREAKFFGHDRMGWLYPEVLNWFASKRRESHPVVIEHEALNAHKGERAWIAIRTVSQGVAYGRKDGGFAMKDLAAVKASIEGQTITIEKVVGKPLEVEVFFDDRLMTGDLTIKWGKTSTSWTPKASAKKLLERVRATGDREQLFADSIIVKH